MLREPAEPPAAAEPKQSGSFRYLQGMLEAGEGGKTPSPFPTRRPTAAPSRPHVLPPSHPSLPPLPLGPTPVAAPFPTPSNPAPQSVRRLSPTPRRSAVFTFFDLHPRSGFQGSGPGPAAPGTSSPRPASWEPR